MAGAEQKVEGAESNGHGPQALVDDRVERALQIQLLNRAFHTYPENETADERRYTRLPLQKSARGRA
jgi:hypothetical protein